MIKFLTIGEASEVLGVTPGTLRRWESSGKLIPERTKGGARRYDASKISQTTFVDTPNPRKTIAYARVSSHDQKNDLERQKQVLEMYCATQGWTFEVDFFTVVLIAAISAPSSCFYKNLPQPVS